ncbi:ABC transporter ATP-binding protein [Carnobacterium antarcticum]|uniref:ABC transporter ATP-binding protein n=1 Tax=Carnobacterium antarcticum TaxID=2126436 RepID=A0ABW4NK10_9LACT|nr:ABC transporter ATP-binding protein [Carnobacterium sp. CP1]ALV21827.1 L-proline glycine betaine ABC transport system permease protein ProV [Carnobacterium sp. CP1]
MIEFKDVSKAYTPGQPVVSNLNLEIRDGEFFVLIGPSGCGKTTTLKMINRLITLTTGYIYVDNKPISNYNIQELRWNMGYVLQQIALFPNMTVEENITVVPEMKKWSKEQMHDRVTELLESIGLDEDDYRQRKISELSGGEQQRIGVVRALAADPDIILMDEPFSALDPISRHNLQKDVADLQKKWKKTVVFVTHDMQEALTLGDRICLMNEGQIVQVGTPDEIRNHPKNDFVRDFLRSGNIEAVETQTIEQLIKIGYLSAIKPNAGTVQGSFLRNNDTIDQLVLALAKESEVFIKDKNDQVIGKVTQAHLLSYLAETIAIRGEAE